MIYLYSDVQCVILNGENKMSILPGVFYTIENLVEDIIVISNNCVPLVVKCIGNSVENHCSNVENYILGNDNFIFLHLNKLVEPVFTSFKCGNKNFSLCVGSELNVAIDGENLLTKKLDTDIKYTHYEKIGDFNLLYFEGLRSFVLIEQNGQIKFADYYDEFNNSNDEKIYMKKQNDLLNHGKVVTLKDNKFETYLVYLDDNELNMKQEFTSLVFMDCFIAGNLKYCNELLNDNIKQKDHVLISGFFEEFDFYIPFKDIVFTFKKNTLSGVYKFEVINNKIDNIIRL